MVGVNPGSLASHKKWSEQFGFNFPILVDAERRVAAAYDALKEDGKGILRSVVIVGKDGKVHFRQTGMPETATLLAALDRINAGA